MTLKLLNGSRDDAIVICMIVSIQNTCATKSGCILPNTQTHSPQTQNTTLYIRDNHVHVTANSPQVRKCSNVTA